VRRRRRIGPSWWFVLPAVLLYGAMWVYPTLSGVRYAFTDWNGLDPHTRFVGLANFRRMAQDEQVTSAIPTTLLLAACIVVLKIGLGLLLALALNRPLRTRGTLRTVFFLPVILTPVIMAFVWKYIYGNAGALNQLLDTVGLHGWREPWLGTPHLALASIVVVSTWQTAGLAMVIFLAGLQGVPRELVEAAMLDGASPWHCFRHITLPMLAPAITVNAVIALIHGLRIFDQVYVLTEGGPGYATETIATAIYKIAFQFAEYGYGSSLSLVFAAVVAAAVFTTAWVLRRRELAIA
jgi:raffinose/stachyose/melibiose transport system permease protein